MTAGYQTSSVEHAAGETSVAHPPLSIVKTDALRAIPDVMTSPFALDGWLEFNRIRWGVQPLRVRLSEDSSEVPAVHAIYYLNRKGQVWKPPTSTYLPMVFESTPTQSRVRLDRQWLVVGDLAVKDMARRGVANRIVLSPEIEDVRPWQWAGFWVTTSYTFLLDFPHPESALDPVLHRQIAESSKAGFSQDRVTDFTDVMRCIDNSEERRGITRSDLDLAAGLVGDDCLRAYVCYAPNGEPASARVVLHRPGGRAIDWLTGTAGTHRESGAAQLLLDRVLKDVYAAGATGFGFDGATFAGLAATRSMWGAELAPVHAIEAPHLAGLTGRARDYWRLQRRRSSFPKTGSTTTC